MVSVKFCPQDCSLDPLDTILGPYARSPTTLQDAGLRKARPTPAAHITVGGHRHLPAPDHLPFAFLGLRVKLNPGL